ncbi:hypothetical protein AHAS_Ahas15G0137200 [Arachis hypogaea]
MDSKPRCRLAHSRFSQLLEAMVSLLEGLSSSSIQLSTEGGRPAAALVFLSWRRWTGWRKEYPPETEEGSRATSTELGKGERNVQWALGKAGEDRVHVVVLEEQDWLFVRIYDGFNSPNAPEFLMGYLYRCCSQ